MQGAGLSWPDRVRLWDGCASLVRTYLRGQGMREVMTPARLASPAIEPWIEPIRAEAGYLRTSPELAIKRLLARGVGSCFELAKVFRGGEIGDWHREEFHLLEWYRVADKFGAEPSGSHEFVQLRTDVEVLVQHAASLVRELGLQGPVAPSRWETWTFDDVWRETTGAPRPADELQALNAAAAGVSGAPAAPLLSANADTQVHYAGSEDSDANAPVLVLAAWSELFSWWSDGALDPWLEARAQAGVGVHIIDFPVPLAALAQVHGEGAQARAQRFESFIGRVELANGYLELADPAEQRRRFARVSAMRDRSGLAALPVDQAFVDDLEKLPNCAGVALGLERLLAWATGAERLDQLALELGAPGQKR